MVTRMQNVESLLNAYTNAISAAVPENQEAVKDARGQLMTYLQAQLGQDRPVIDLQTLLVDPLPLLGTEGVEFPGTLIAHDAAWECVVVHGGRVHANVPQRLKLMHLDRTQQRRVVTALRDLKLITYEQYAAWQDARDVSRRADRASQFRAEAQLLGITLTPDQLEKLS